MKNQKKIIISELQRLDIKHAADNSPPVLDEVLPGLLAGTVGSLVGTGGVGKTYVSLGFSAAVTAGIPVLGGVWDAPRHTGKVAVLAAEDPLLVLQTRMHHFAAWIRHQYPQRSEQIISTLDEDFSLYSLVDVIPHLLNKNSEINQEIYGLIFEIASSSRLLIIDPLRQFHMGDENDSSHISLLIQILQQIAHKARCAILFTHHAGKASVLNGQADSAQASRGSGALTDNVRWQANVFGIPPKLAESVGLSEEERKFYVKLDLAKSNYAPPQSASFLRKGEGGVLSKVDLCKPQRGMLKVETAKPSSLDEVLRMEFGGSQ